MNKSIETLQNLLRIPSYSGKEAAIQEHILHEFSASGIEVFQQDENVVVHLKGKDQTRAFIFNSHVDVVDVGDEKRWAHDPWGAEIVDGKIYGRGASDMKSGVAASMEAAKILAKREELPCDVWFTYVVREEEDGAGTISFAAWFKGEGYLDQYKEIAAVFTEPTDMNSLEYGHRGNYFLIASIDGDAGHSSRPKDIKIHAIEHMMDFVHDLRSQTKEWEDQFAGGEFAPPSVTPTRMIAHSKSTNKVSDHAEAGIDLRTIPGFHEEAYKQVCALATKWGITITQQFEPGVTGYTDPNSRIVQELARLIPELELTVSAGSADLGSFTEIGIEGIIFGPGEKSQCHVIDESAPVDHLGKAIEIYVKLYDAWGNNSPERT